MAIQNYKWKKDLYHLKIYQFFNCFGVTRRMGHYLKTGKQNLTFI